MIHIRTHVKFFFFSIKYIRLYLQITTYKLKPFYGAKVCFFGFPEEEKKHMCEVLEQQGGESTEIDNPNCTHVVS